MRTLTLANVVETLAERVEPSLDQLVTDPQRADHGALINAAWGLPTPGINVALITSSALLYLHSVSARGA